MTAFKALIAASTVLASAGAACATDLEVTHWWTSGGEAAAVAEFAKAFDATGNHWVDGAIAGSGGTARPIMISRITGGDPMGATQFNHGRQAEELVEAGPDARPDRRRQGRELGGGRQPAERCSKLHARRQDLLRAGQHPLLAVAVALQRGLREGRRAGADELGRVRRRRAGAARRPASCRSPSGGQAWQHAGALQRAAGRARRQGRLPEGLQATRTPRSPPGRRWRRSSRPPTTPARWPRARTCRTGTRRPTWSSPARPAARSWATGRRASSRSRARSPARTTPACRASACTDDHHHRRRRLLLPASSRIAEKSKAQEVLASTMLRPGDPGRLQPQEGLAAGARRRRPRRRQRLHEEGPRRS